MTTHFITAELDLQDSVAAIQDLIQVELQKYGHPLRWAVTAVNLAQKKLILEAIVTRDN